MLMKPPQELKLQLNFSKDNNSTFFSLLLRQEAIPLVPASYGGFYNPLLLCVVDVFAKKRHCSKNCVFLQLIIHLYDERRKIYLLA